MLVFQNPLRDVYMHLMVPNKTIIYYMRMLLLSGYTKVAYVVMKRNIVDTGVGIF